MSKRNRQTFKKRAREMAKKEKKQSKTERLAARRAGQGPSEPTPEEIS